MYLVLQGLAFLTATAATLLVPAGNWPDWAIRAAISSAALSVVLLATGLLLSKARGWEPARPGEHDWRHWPIPFGLTLMLIAGLAVYAASPLPGLWSEILDWLNRNIDWGDLCRGPRPTRGSSSCRFSSG